MLIVRSLVFNVLFYVVIIGIMLVGLPMLLGPPLVAIRVSYAFSRSVDWLMRHVLGLTVEVRGREHLPPGPALIAAKHQSLWETVGMLLPLDSPVFIVKRELMRLPLYGWYCVRTGMIGVDRDGGAKALRRMAQEARAVLAAGRSIIIYPEGTRSAVGAPPDYKPGIGLLYAQLNVPCVPVALNSGLFWGRRSFLRYPGKIILEFLPPIPPGLPRAEFMARLQRDIETATDALVAEARSQSLGQP